MYLTLVLTIVLWIPFLSCEGCYRHSEQKESAIAIALDLRNIEEQSKIKFPSGATILFNGDDGGREPGYYEWVVFSKEGITLPPQKGLGGQKYVQLPVDVTVKMIRARVRIPDASSALGSDWNANGYAFRGTLATTSQGDYLLIQRFQPK